ncbi:MAG: hypothetical protein ACD_7C00044G0004 [uncultured bacterium]|nr:MAG: hypothetical protein ACD_7C00044G0004 [uncultured bacterium]
MSEESEKTSASVVRKKILVGVIFLIGLIFFNYLFYLSKTSAVKNQIETDRENVVTLLKSKNYNVEKLPYAVVDIKDVDDIKTNKDFFVSVEENDRVYYFENQETNEYLTALYRPETGMLINVKKD